MTPLATGVDLIEVDRFALALERHGERLLGRIFTARERSVFGGDVRSLAARFAAKEAVVKALSTGIGPVGWHEVEVLRGEAREPLLLLHGEAARLAEAQGLGTWSLSLTHTQSTALAFVVAVD